LDARVTRNTLDVMMIHRSRTENTIWGMLAFVGGGLSSANAALRVINHVALSWMAMVWEIMTLLGWIGLTPMLLDERPIASRAMRGGATGLTPTEVATHLLLVGVLTVLHAAVIVALSGLLFS
jgi:hypothetical protein